MIERERPDLVVLDIIRRVSIAWYTAASALIPYRQVPILFLTAKVAPAI
jgi:hypothetical protein